MKKFLKILLKVLVSVLGLLIVLAIIAVIYINRSLINVDGKDKFKDVEIKELIVEGYTFRDLNRNGSLDIYEDTRQAIENRVNDVLSQMTLDEKIHLLKGSGMKSLIGSGSQKDGIPGAAGTIIAISRGFTFDYSVRWPSRITDFAQTQKRR